MENPKKCRLPKPPLPVGAGIRAYWWCDEETGEWVLSDEWVADSENIDNEPE